LHEGVALPDLSSADHGNLAYLLALLLVERDKAEEGLSWLDIAARELPRNPRIRYNQGLLLLQLQRPDAARAALESGLEQNPADSDLLYALAYLHAVSGRRDQASAIARQLEQVAPGDPRLPGFKRQLGAP
jgi:tetratricopeptide (TPR) repeat protein